MNINNPVYVCLDENTGHIIGNGECSIISSNKKLVDADAKSAYEMLEEFEKSHVKIVVKKFKLVEIEKE